MGYTSPYRDPDLTGLTACMILGLPISAGLEGARSSSMSTHIGVSHTTPLLHILNHLFVLSQPWWPTS